MTVQQLINILETLPDKNMQIRYDDYEQGTGFEINSITHISYKFIVAEKYGGGTKEEEFYNITSSSDNKYLINYKNGDSFRAEVIVAEGK